MSLGRHPPQRGLRSIAVREHQVGVHDLAETEIGEDCVALGVDENVGTLKTAMQDVDAMKVLQAFGNVVHLSAGMLVLC